MRHKLYLLLILGGLLQACQKAKTPASSSDVPIEVIRKTADSLRREGNKIIMDDSEKARTFYEKALNICQPVLPKNDELMLKLYHNIGSSYFNEGDYFSALDFFDSVTIHQPQTPITWIQAQNDFKTGKCFWVLNEIPIAKLFLEKAAQNAPFHPNSRPILSDIFMQYAECFRKEKNFKEAINWSQKAIDSSFAFSERTTQDSIIYANSLFSMSNNYAQMQNNTENKNYQQAAYYAQQALSIYRKVNADFEAAKVLINLTDYQRFTKNYQEAFKSVGEGLEKIKKVKYDTAAVSGLLYTKIGNIYADQKRIPQALAAYDMAMFYLTYKVRNNTEGGTLLHVNTEQSKRAYLMTVLNDAAVARTQLLEQGDKTQQKAIAATYQAISQLTEMIRRDYLSEDAKLNLSADVKPILEQAFIFSRPLSIEQAFQFSEQSKAMSLLEAVRVNNRDISSKGKEAQTIKLQLDKLKKERTAIEKQLGDVLPNSAEAQKLNTDLTKNFSNHRNASIKFNKVMGVENANDTLVSIKSIQEKLLDEDQALIEYFIHDSILNIFYLTQHEPLSLDTVHLPKNFAEIAHSVIAAAAKPNGMQQKNFCLQTHYLYQLLLEPIILKKKPLKRLIIVAENPLSNLPFDMLLTKPATNYTQAVAEKKTLLYQYALSYSYSTNLLWEMRFRNKTHGQQGIAAFAPAFQHTVLADTNNMNLPLKESYKGLTPLSNLKEIQNIGNKAHLFPNEKATTQAFLDACRNNNAVHIATHCMVNYTNPDFNYISFSQDQDSLNRHALFYLKDLYANPLQLDLMVFSACQTAIGKEVSGEAPLSMARGLAYAGVRSFITTEWLVNSSKNAEFYKIFYDALATGKSKDMALQEAKIHFIENEDGNEDPNFWASMVLIGNAEPIDFQAVKQGSGLGIIAVVGGLILLFLFRKKGHFKK